MRKLFSEKPYLSHHRWKGVLVEKDGGKQFPKLHNGSLSGSLINLRKRRNQTNRNKTWWCTQISRWEKEKIKQEWENDRHYLGKQKEKFSTFYTEEPQCKECYTVKSATWYQSVDYSLASDMLRSRAGRTRWVTRYQPSPIHVTNKHQLVNSPDISSCCLP